MRLNPWLPWLYAVPMIVFVDGDLRLSDRHAVPLQRPECQHLAPCHRSFAGLGNFRYIFSDALFSSALLNNLKLFLCVPIMVVLSVILAAILFDRPRGWQIYRTLLFIPYVLSIPVVGVVFGYIFEYRGRAEHGILRAAGLDLLGRATGWAARPGRCRPSCSSSSGRSSASASCSASPG